jgi:hypothetical protein
MRMILRAAACISMAFALSGCAAVLVGGLMYDHTRSREDKRQFTEKYNQQNLEREKAGLAKLDWCSEVYKFSKSWAGEQPGCGDRIKRYEAGDQGALSV